MPDKKIPVAAMILGGLMIAVASGLIGGYGGSQLAGTFLLNNTLDKDARDIVKQVEALKQLRAGQAEQAIEMLEARLDDDLIILDPQKPYEGLTAQTQLRIKQARDSARDYRQTHPRSSNRPHVDESVQNFLSR